MKTINVTGMAEVDDLVMALGLDKIPDGCTLNSADDVEITISADRSALEDEIREDDDELDYLDKGEIIDLAAAVRRGDTAEAERLLDGLFGNFAGSEKVTEWIQQGRFSRRARPSTAPERLRAVA
jgi:hypothetical protein